VGRIAQISREAVLTAALALADEAGLDAVTMHAVGRRLGVTPMALYRHVDGKNALLDGLVEALLTEVTETAAQPTETAAQPPGTAARPPEAAARSPETVSRQEGPAPWEGRLIALAYAIRATARRHPAAFPLLISRPAVTPAARGAREQVYAGLREAGLPPGSIARAERLVSTAILGFAVSEAAGRFAAHDEAVIDADFAELLRWLRLALSELKGRGLPRRG
jgi:AcrR family transcriptional regulator